jgi:hypothetical protein
MVSSGGYRHLIGELKSLDPMAEVNGIRVTEKC